MSKKCKHGKSFCCQCEYGGTGHRHESKDLDNPRDLVDEIKRTSKHRKLKEYYGGQHEK